MSAFNQRANRWSILITSLIQVILIILLYFITAWQSPDPPIPTYGIELDMAMEGNPINQESSLNQNQTSPENSASENTENENQQDESLDSNEVIESAENESTENTKIQEADDSPQETITDDSPETVPEVEETLQEVSEEEEQIEETTTDKASTNPEKDNEPSEEMSDAIDTVSIDDTNPAETSQESSVVIDERALFSSSNSGPANENKNYELDIAGFRLSEEPVINDTSDEEGSITIKIIVGDDGYVARIEVISSSVSPAVSSIYRDAVSQLYFEKTSSQVPPQTTGTIKFIIKSN